MGSVVVSEIAHDTVHFTRPPNMLAGRTHQRTDINTPISNNTAATSPYPRRSHEQRSPPPSSTSSHSITRDSVHSHNPYQHDRTSHSSGAVNMPSEPRSHALPPVDAQIDSSSRIAEPRTAPSDSPSSSSHCSSSPTSPSSDLTRRIKVKNLQHIQDLVGEDGSIFHDGANDELRSDAPAPQYEISEMPVTDVIEMVAGLLTKITTTNDQQHRHLHQQIPPPDTTAGLSNITSSVLAFHGKNVPSITILSYLSRIHKYCPATYEVFLSLLVYFDRITERVNSGPLQILRQSEQDLSLQEAPDHSEALADRRRYSSDRTMTSQTRPEKSAPGEAATQGVPGLLTPPLSELDAYNLAHFFVVDSFNIHRLVIAGVTCASKFFSDVFFTNSRYAKVFVTVLAWVSGHKLTKTRSAGCLWLS